MKYIFSLKFLVLGLQKTAKRFVAPVSNRELSLKTEQGYSLVEVLVAITVLLIALVGPLTIAHSGLKRANESKVNTLAVFLAQEGIEALVKLREDDALDASTYSDIGEVWNNMTTIAALCPVGGADRCGVQIAEDGSVTTSSFYRCSGSNCVIDEHTGARVPLKQRASGGTATVYTRELSISVDNSLARVRAEVSWGDDPSDSVTLESYVYNTYYEP